MTLLLNAQLNKEFLPMPKAGMTAQFAESCRLLHAAIVNRRFREDLLRDPLHATDAGYCGESFHFSPEARQHLRGIRATSLGEFASALTRPVETPRVVEMVPCRKH
jgi:hypothetical protein